MKTKMNLLNSAFLFFIFSYVSFAGYVFPTFDMNRWPWENFRINHVPIVVESGFSFGLTNPTIGQTPYSFHIYPINGKISYQIPSLYGDITIDVLNSDLYIYGNHNGPGNPLNGLIMEGYGDMKVYEKNFSTNEFNYAGEFHVNGIPEPSTLMLFSVGFILCKKNKRC